MIQVFGRVWLLVALAVVFAVRKHDTTPSILVFSYSYSTPFLTGHQKYRSSALFSSVGNTAVASHTVQDVRCTEVVNELPFIGRVVVLEATADAQEELVDECLELEDERNKDKPKRIAEGDPYG